LHFYNGLQMSEEVSASEIITSLLLNNNNYSGITWRSLTKTGFAAHLNGLEKVS
jgi:hypothetical protein